MEENRSRKIGWVTKGISLTESRGAGYTRAHSPELRRWVPDENFKSEANKPPLKTVIDFLSILVASQT
jgi:hypothetical protein